MISQFLSEGNPLINKISKSKAFRTYENEKLEGPSLENVGGNFENGDKDV